MNQGEREGLLSVRFTGSFIVANGPSSLHGDAPFHLTLFVNTFDSNNGIPPY